VFRNRSLIATYLVVVVVIVVVVGATSARKPMAPSFHHRIGMKFGRNVLQVNTHRLTESDFPFFVTLSKMAAMTSYQAKKCCRLVSAHEASTGRIYSSVRQFLIHAFENRK